MDRVCKILQLGLSENYAGTESYVMNQYRTIDKNLINYDFMDMLDPEKKICCYDEIVSQGCKIWKIPFPRRKYNILKSYFNMTKWMFLHRKDYDAVVYNMNNHHVVYPLLVARIFGVKKVIAHSHNSEYEGKISFFKNIFYKINKFILNLSVTDRWACSIVAGKFLFGNKDFLIIKNGINLRRFLYSEINRKKIRQEYNIGNQILIGHVGRLCYQKNQEYLLDIFIDVCRKRDDFILMCVGDEPENFKKDWQLQRKIKDNNLEKKIIFAGKHKNINEYYSAFDCFVLPSRFEGLPLVGIEAQAAGLKCFFSNKITVESNPTGLVEFIDIAEKDISRWSDKIINANFYDRENKMEVLREKGFDLMDQVKIITEYYRK